ncbi:MAG: hypothetical protein HC924_03945 [Synechococcaceae cyanobacterium SM2_3_2]|nr:hypothetical protein [Synechococcaceae cyanobacterium SM2_3_2]
MLPPVELVHFLHPWPLAGILLLNLAVTPVEAHTIKADGEVGVLFHLEPDHNPKAGDPALVWFALTRRGGEAIGFDACDCRLAVYAAPSNPDLDPLLEPDLEPIDAESFVGIPGAEVVFPEVGAYVLELSGDPVMEGDFDPFQLTYEVTVTR